MKEFIMLIRKPNSNKEALPADTQLEFLKSCQLYIEELGAKGHLLAAQPIERAGCIISKPQDSWLEHSFNINEEVLGGYYLIRAKDLGEAIELAKQNPEFTFNPGARIEVRPLKMKEDKTGYEYPDKG
jgi:hypothetical protein